MYGDGGYRIKTELQLDLDSIRQHAEIIKSIAEISDEIGKENKRGLIANSRKIKKLVDTWIGVG